MDQNHGDNNSMIPKMNHNMPESSKNAQRRLKSPKNSNVTSTKNSGQQKKVTLKHLQINNPSDNI